MPTNRPRNGIRVALVAIVGTAVLGLGGPARVDAAFPGANGVIAYGSLADGAVIRIVAPDGGGNVVLTDGRDPAWTADGSRLALARGRDLWIMDADGSSPQRITNNPGEESDDSPSWSPDGARLAVNGQHVVNGRLTPGVFILNADGSGRRLLVVAGANPAWSPDGETIAFQDENGIDLISPDGTGRRDLECAGFSQDPNWAPDGSLIAYSEAFPEDHGFGNDIGVATPDCSSARLVTNTGVESERQPAWSPDGSRIVFTGNGHLQSIRADGTDERPVTDGENDAAPDWRPIAAAIPVTIDVRPRNVNVRSRGLVPVAIISEAGFDARTVLPLSVCFGDADGPDQRDCSEAHGRGHFTDLQDDGDTDLLLHFQVRQTGIDRGDRRACLTGRTSDGGSLTGCDAIRAK